MSLSLSFLYRCVSLVHFLAPVSFREEKFPGSSRYLCTLPSPITLVSLPSPRVFHSIASHWTKWMVWIKEVKHSESDVDFLPCTTSRRLWHVLDCVRCGVRKVKTATHYQGAVDNVRRTDMMNGEWYASLPCSVSSGHLLSRWSIRFPSCTEPEVRRRRER